MSKTKVIAFANNKGGSGKSTTCSNVAYVIASMGHRVLLIDGDMQMNLTLSFFSEDDALEYARSGKNLYTAIKDQKDISDFITKTEYENLDIVPSSTLMSAVEFDLFTKWQREFILKKGLSSVLESEEYDYVLIDAPPTLGGWVMNILCASDYLVVPVEASPWGLFGLANMFDFYSQVKTMSPALELLGIVITKADERKNYFKGALQSLRDLDGVRLFDSIIRVDSAVEWAQDNSKPVTAYKKSSRSSLEYNELAKEIMKYVSR